MKRRHEHASGGFRKPPASWRWSGAQYAARILGATGRAAGLLVVAEVALAVLLLTGAGLLIRSFAELARVDPASARRASSPRGLPD